MILYNIYQLYSLQPLRPVHTPLLSTDSAYILSCTLYLVQHQIELQLIIFIELTSNNNRLRFI